MIRDAEERDAEAISEIYNHYVSTTAISFEEEPVSAEQMCSRIVKTLISLPWLVLEEEGRVVAYAYASPWRERCAYRYSVEGTVYVVPDALRQGHGWSVYKALIERLRGTGFQSVLGGISLPNPASVALHERLGFEQVAEFKQVGWKMGRWVDVGYWQLLLHEGMTQGS